MNATMRIPAENRTTAPAEMEFTTFYVGDLLLGIDIQQAEEINRQLNVTPVPHTPDNVRGVVNLRGEVVTVIDLRKTLGLQPTVIGANTRNVIIRSRHERIGLLVDRIADVARANSCDIEPPPSNVNGIDGKFFTGVYKLESELVVILDVETVLAGESPGR